MMIGRDYARDGFDHFPLLVPDTGKWDKLGKRLRRKSLKMLRTGKFPLGFLLHGMATHAEGRMLHLGNPAMGRRLKQHQRLVEHVLADRHPVIAKIAASERGITIAAAKKQIARHADRPEYRAGAHRATPGCEQGCAPCYIKCTAVRAVRRWWEHKLTGLQGMVATTTPSQQQGGQIHA